MRSINQIESDITALRVQYDNWNNLQNEGAEDGFNPHANGFTRLAKELSDAQADVCPLKTDLAKERAWFNAQGFTRPDVAQKACRERGYNMSDLKAACK